MNILVKKIVHKICDPGGGGVTFVVHGIIFSTEEIVSMPAPPAACGYARLKPCDYAGRKRPALPEQKRFGGSGKDTLNFICL